MAEARSRGGRGSAEAEALRQRVALPVIPTISQFVKPKSERLLRCIKEFEAHVAVEYTAIEKGEKQAYDPTVTSKLDRSSFLLASKMDITAEFLPLVSQLRVSVTCEAVKKLMMCMSTYREDLVDMVENPPHFPESTDDPSFYWNLIKEEVLSFGAMLAQAARVRWDVKKYVKEVRQQRYRALTCAKVSRSAEVVDSIISSKYIHPVDLSSSSSLSLHQGGGESGEGGSAAGAEVADDAASVDSFESSASIASLSSLMSVSSTGSATSLRSKKQKERKRKAALEEVTHLYSSPQVFLEAFLKQWRERQMVADRTKELEEMRDRLTTRLARLEDERKRLSMGEVGGEAGVDKDETSGGKDAEHDMYLSPTSHQHSGGEGEDNDTYKRYTQKKDGYDGDEHRQSASDSWGSHHSGEHDNSNEEGSSVSMVMSKLAVEEMELAEAKKKDSAVYGKLKQVMDGIKKMMQLAVDARGEKGGVERKNGKESGKGSASKKAEAEEEKNSTSQHGRSADSGRVEEDESVDGASSTMSLIGVEVEDVQRELDSLCEAVEGMQNETAEMGAAKEGRKKQAGKGRGESSRAVAKVSSSSSHLQHVQTLSSGKGFSMPAVGGSVRLQRGGGMRESRIEEKSEEEEGGAGKVQSRHVHGSVRARGQRHSSAGSDGDDSGSDGEVEERQQERGSRSEEEGEEEEGEDRVVGPVWRRRTGNIVLPASVPSVKRKRGGKKKWLDSLLLACWRRWGERRRYLLRG
uniref:Uncharacterized protein n=1 Tax=Palpitomonas bilix TaxID=652834 RepID=A0A7S3D827_9EUKA|mmetsp:Transcript_25518/g.63900  ORF Transcript_25518/g.63900 Transcript_25518/m.63900 type:complete len:748 (+) Transcript_25518:152-2395(+)